MATVWLFVTTMAILLQELVIFPSGLGPEGADKRSLELTEEIRCERIIFKMHNEVVGGKWNEGAKDFSARGPLVEHLKVLMHQFQHWLVKSVSPNRE